MSVDKLRGSYHVNSVSPNEIGLLLSAQSYRPAVTAAVNKIKEGEWRTLQSLVSNVISPGPHPKYDGTYPCLKTKNVQDLIADTTPADWADVSSINDLAKVQVGKGDLLINLTGAGSIGRVSVYYGDDLPITNQHIAKMSPNNLIDEGYLVAYLRSFYAERALEQGVAGSTGQINMVNEHVRCAPVRICHSSAQKYIGEKVRQAERLRSWAKNAEKVFNQALKSAYPNVFNMMGSGNCYSFARSQEIDYTLNVGAFDEERLLTQRYLYEHGGRKLAEIAKIANESTSEYEENQVYIGLSSIASNSCELKPSTIAEQEITGTCRILKSGPVVAKLRPYLNKVSYVPEKLSGSLGSTELLCIEPNKDTSGWFIYGVLKSELILKQLRPLASGATHPRVDQHDLRNIVIPSVENPHELGQLLEQAQTAYFLSEKCTKLAKLLVEELIEDQVSEAELVAAQQALEAGDDSLDRALLERMTAEGVDGEGGPLFDDVDQLYDLLEQAKQALDVEDTMAEV